MGGSWSKEVCNNKWGPGGPQPITMARSLKIDADGRLAVPESNVQRTCIEWMEATFGYRYVATNASDLTRAKRPAHERYTLDGLFIAPSFKIDPRWMGMPVIVVEWKRRQAKTEKARRDGQAATEKRLRGLGFQVIRMPDGLSDPIGWFKTEVVRVL